jgi:hypothetical protein
MACFRPRIALGGAVLVLLCIELGSWDCVPEARADGGWMFSTANRPAETGSAPGSQSLPTDTPAEHRSTRGEATGHIFGYPTRQDPLFDNGTRLSYEHQHLERPRWNRPRYDANLPQYVKPSWAQEPIHKPAYHMPQAFAPLDNRPKYTINNYAPPSDFKPSYEFPTYMDRPNYVIRPIEKPAINRPGYDRSGVFYNRPEYNPPVYTPEAFKPLRYAPSPFIAPAP